MLCEFEQVFFNQQVQSLSLLPAISLQLAPFLKLMQDFFFQLYRTSASPATVELFFSQPSTPEMQCYKMFTSNESTNGKGIHKRWAAGF